MADAPSAEPDGPIVTMVADKLALLLTATVGGTQPATRPSGPPDASAAGQLLLRVAGPGFRLKRTAHFLVAFDTSAKLVSSLAQRLESTYAGIERFCRSHRLPMRPPVRPMEVIFFDTFEAYRRYAERMGFPYQGTYGFYLDRCNRSAFFNAQRDPKFVGLRARIDRAEKTLAALRRSLSTVGARGRVRILLPDGETRILTRTEAERHIEETQNRVRRLRTRLKHYSDRINQMVIQHEAAHQVLYNVGLHVRGGPNPAWLVEGLACLFETPPSASGAGLGATNAFRLADFREALAGPSRSPRVEDLTEAIADGRLVPLEQLVCRHDLFCTDGAQATWRYAQAWALACYLDHHRHEAFADYIRRVASRQPGTIVPPGQELAEFEAAFGPIDATFEYRWVRYILSLPFRPPANP